MRHILFIIILASTPATAKTKIDVSPFDNKTAAGPCNIVEPWKKDIEQNFKHQLINALTETGNFNIVEPELMRGEERSKLYDSGVSTMHKSVTFKAAQYSVIGILKSFDLCDNDANVVLEINVIENADGSVKHKFVSTGHSGNRNAGNDFKGAPFNTGLFKDSPIGKATISAISDATNKLKRAFPEREIASEDYKIKTIHRSRAR